MPLPVGEACEAFCQTGFVECNAILLIPTVEECEQTCERDLQEETAVSVECGAAVEGVFLCAGELSCEEFGEFLEQQPPSNYPCRTEVVQVDTTCEGS